MRSSLLIILAAAALLLGGCSGGAPANDGLTSQEQQTSSRLDQIAKATGGEWDKLTPEDRKFLVDEVAQGSEQSAQMLLKSKANRLKATPGGSQPK
ncbi:MAG: hypothetical protein ACOYON_01880 [Fimbriimonas sp.]